MQDTEIVWLFLPYIKISEEKKNLHILLVFVTSPAIHNAPLSPYKDWYFF